MEMFGQDMEQESVNKTDDRHSRGFPAGFFPGVLEPERDNVIFNTDNSVVVDGGGVGIPADILDHFCRARKWRLGIDHPVFRNGMEQPLFKCAGAGVLSQFIRQFQQAFAVGCDQSAEEFGPEYVGKCPDRKKKGRIVLGFHPLALCVDPACGDNEMDVGMQPELAAPGMKNAVKTDLGTQALGVFPELQQGLGGIFKQKVVHDPPIEPAQGIEHTGQGENTMVIGYRQKILDPGLNPSSSGDVIAARTMAVPTGVVSFFQMAAGIADFPVGAEVSASAVLDVIHDFMLPGMQPVCLPVGSTIFFENITDSGTCVRLLWKCGMTRSCLHGLSKPTAQEIRGAQLARIYDRRVICAFCKWHDWRKSCAKTPPVLR